MQARIGAGPTSFSHLGRGPLFRSAFSKFHVFLARILRPRSSFALFRLPRFRSCRESRDCQRLLRNLHRSYFRGVSDPERCREYHHAPSNRISVDPLARCLPEERNESSASIPEAVCGRAEEARVTRALANSHGY